MYKRQLAWGAGRILSTKREINIGGLLLVQLIVIGSLPAVDNPKTVVQDSDRNNICFSAAHPLSSRAAAGHELTAGIVAHADVAIRREDDYGFGLVAQINFQRILAVSGVAADAELGRQREITDLVNGAGVREERRVQLGVVGVEVGAQDRVAGLPLAEIVVTGVVCSCFPP